MMPSTHSPWIEISGRCQQWLTARQQCLEGAYALSGCAWELQQDDGMIRYRRGRDVVANAQCTMIGSYHLSKGTWMWAWANPSVNTTHALSRQALMDVSQMMRVRQLLAPVINVSQMPVLWGDQMIQPGERGRVAVARLVSIAAYQIQAQGVQFFRTAQGIGCVALRHLYRPTEAG